MTPGFLEHDLTSACLCWRLERRDGAGLGFTTHDRDLVIDGLTYRAAPGMLPSAVSVSAGFDADNVDVRGALSGDAIRAEDLKAGRWDGAAVAIFMTDWRSPGAELLHVARGTLGEVSLVGEGFTAELKGPTAALDAPVVEQTSPECRATLGDKRCRVDMGGARADGAGDGVGGGGGGRGGRGGADAECVWAGAAAVVGGRNSGLVSDLRGSAGQALTLREAPVFEPATGDLVELSEGCDRRFETCVVRFGNGVNFRGEPHLPGIDLLTRY